MSEEKYKEILKNNIDIINYYGIKAQMPIWIEEMSELIKEICKWARNYDKLEGDINDNLVKSLEEEITDVTVCLDQLKYLLMFDEDMLMKKYAYKVERQLKRIEEEK